MVQVPRRESLTLLFRSKRQRMAKTTLHDSAALHRGVIPLCRGGGTAARPRAPPRCRSFAACPAAVSPIRFRSPPFKREYEYLNKHLAINQLLLFTARRHTIMMFLKRNSQRCMQASCHQQRNDHQQLLRVLLPKKPNRTRRDSCGD